jgi:hypothetical protein
MTDTPGEPVSYNNFGAGVMFIPSGLGYYNIATTTIPAYAQLMFEFKLYKVQRSDNDSDGILSNDEDLNGNGIFTDDDTDGDGIYNFVDSDDDGDGYLTRNEIKYTLNNVTYLYPYNGAAVNDPDTPIDETRGVPRKFTGESVLIPGTGNQYWNMPAADDSDFKDPGRLRRYLDNTAMPPFYDNQ